MKTHVVQDPDKAEATGVVWKPKFIRHGDRVKKKPPTLAELNARLAASHKYRVAAAEANGLKLIGKNRL